MNITDVTNLTSEIFEEPKWIDIKTTTRSTTIILFWLFNSTRTFPFLRPTTPILILLKKFFIFQSSFNRQIRYAELAILSLALPLYVIIFLLCMELTFLQVSRNTAISGGRSRSRTQRTRQRLRSLMWTSNYLLVDFLNLLYEVAYVIIHLSGILPLDSFAGRLYCQMQVYIPLYLTVLMAYSLTAISIYRRRHFVNLNRRISRSFKGNILMISALWIMPIITAILPSFVLVYWNILRITHHETTNQCQISYTYESNLEAIYIFYRLGMRRFLCISIESIVVVYSGNIFLLPISISLACYLAIYVDLIRMQRRFNRAFKRHLHIRKNLISQILFLFLNFAVFWLPAEIIILYTKNPGIKDAAQVIKCLNILLDPLVITGFDTRFSSAARQLLSKWPFNQLTRCLNIDRPHSSSSITQPAILKTYFHSTVPSAHPQKPQVSTWNMANNDDITILESVYNQPSQTHRPKRKLSKTVQNHKELLS